MHAEKRREKLWKKLLAASTSLVLYELAAESSFYLLEISLFLLAVLFVMEETQALLHPVKAVREGVGLLSRLGGVWGLCALYLCWELFTVSFSPYPKGVWEKYRVVLLMIFFSILIVWDSREERGWLRRRRVLLYSIAAAGTAAAAVVLLGCVFPVLYPVVYGRRLSLRLDYNLFSEVVLMGLIAGSFLQREAVPWRTRFFFMHLLAAPVVVLSSSRRNTVFLCCFIVWEFLHSLFGTKKEERLKMVCGWLALLFAIIAAVWLEQSFLDWSWQRMQEKNIHTISGSHGAALERYGQSSKEEGPSKRRVIWSVALREQGGYTAKEKLMGKGFGYDRLLYQMTDDRELLEAYPPESRSLLSAHCFVLTDLLNGGWIQALMGLGIWLQLAVRLILGIWQGKRGTMFFAITLGMTFANNLISNRYGFLYDKYFWLLLAMYTAFLKRSGDTKSGGSRKKLLRGLLG